ncbi:16S rRNA (guanine(527)-N(7))-methyltransferase RsmG [Ligilactobacillus ceti]|uniref:Ribosomal RNA small subunit methyltransferase G n=1 Tax=Ligilactobacillus ceti DSM 22408 TaxID=1122146 RepID=A0A0R2KJZ8_9LACO|nr:16S rRNA (guanine(527)-N(7))-methyltransferase RsmG [Ligilactobacillus ceti]KRN89547.1 16S rRNA methyltransferase GidB [Ligilactobacillus ceti DSM 22408]
MTPEKFRALLAEKGIVLSDYQMEQFATYYEFLVATNENVNLTAITDRDEVYLKHFYDSLLPAFEYQALQTEALNLCDVGAGAGFPSIPLKIAFPNLKVTIVDSLNKRITFLNELADKLALTDVHFYHARAEEFAKKGSPYRESFDLVTARAVARLSVLAEFCLPLVKIGGDFVALKAQKTQEELSDGKYAIALLGGKVISDTELTLPEVGDERHIVVVAKKKPTPNKYPRKAGTPTKKPLIKK